MTAARRGNLVTLALLAPSLLSAILLLVIPILIVIAFSFAEQDTYGGAKFGFTLASYRELFQAIYVPIFVNSLQLAAVSTFVCLLVGYPIAYFIALRAGRYAGILLALLLIPFWIDFIVRMSAWMVLLGRSGTINSALLGLGLVEQPIRMIGTYPAVLVGMLYAFLPTTVLPIHAALNGLDKRLLEAADDLGATPLQSFWRVTFPLSLPGVMAAILFVFVPAMGVYAIPVLLGGGKSIILGNLIVQLFLDFRNIPLGAAVSVVLLAISSVIIVCYMRVLRSVEEARA
ncbi:MULTISPECIES: ABC transporter permease [unclassified Shinella]|uniref:ABC transporter permease n=1 Tax=unclassified Shinella TaxID=2643062 RepID=UPI0003C54C9E|nr:MULTISPECIES: ABC transporter permease [unclassified Shinella]MCA0343743.1 ABC transporter permease [Pseudomonadota bacterium]EYR84443.1 spermidine/putrescine transport system permease protein PotB [Shinella sp. DD12]MCO5148858.1 ABC transporter permease [Shinella sp.]MDC7264917.1 ABC transporter permease [Shinella sp. HY16]MDC7271814.1 ABC transporter permease [Shinella sp. YZ44]